VIQYTYENQGGYDSLGSDEKLKRERGVSFDMVVEIIQKEEYLDLIINPSRNEQFMFIILLHEYVYTVPFLIDTQKNIILKTMYPSRKYTKIYGKKNS